METTEHKNPLLEKARVPGEKFRLPSGGIFYTNGELDNSCKNGEVYVNAMNAMDELVLKSPDRLLSGEAILEVFRRCVSDVRKPEDLLAKDVDFLLMALRMVSYGPQIEVAATHSCENAKEHSYIQEIRPILQKTKPIDPSAIKKFKLTLSNGQVVDLHPPKFMITIKIYQAFSLENNDEGAKELGEILIESVADMISAVDDHTNRDNIHEWIKQIRIGDIQLINEKIAKLSDWGISPTIEVECRDCKEKMEVMVPINPISFFI